MSNPSHALRRDIDSILNGGGPRTLSSTDGRVARIFREEDFCEPDSEPEDDTVQTTAPAQQSYELNSSDDLSELFSTQLSLGRETRPSAYPDCRPGEEYYRAGTPPYVRSARTPVPVRSLNEQSSKDRESGAPATSTPLPDELTIAPDGTRMITTSNHPDAPGVRVTLPFDSFKPKSSPTSDGAKHTADREGRDPNSSMRPPPSHPHRTPSSAMGHAANKSFPPLFSLIRRRSLPHIARPDFGREKEHNQTSPRPSDGPTRPSVPGQSRGRRPPRGREYETYSMSMPFRGETATMTSRGPDGSMHVYSTHHQPHTSYVPLPMNIPSYPQPQQPSLTFNGANHIAGGHFPISSMPIRHPYSTPSIMMHAATGFNSTLPTSISAPIPVRRHSLPHIYPEFGREEAYDQTGPQSYDGSIQSPVSVQSPNERSFTDTEYEVAGSYAASVMSTPFRGATYVIESGSPYAVQRTRGHTQEGSDGSNSGWRTVAANVIDWSGKAHGHHPLDSASGPTVSNTTTVGEQHQSSVPYPMVGTHSDFPMTPRTVNTGSHHDHDYYVPSPSYPMSRYHGSFGSPQSISSAALFGPQQSVVPSFKTESLELDLASSYPSNIWQQPHASQSLQEDDDKDTSVDDDAKSPSPDSSLPNTPAAVELALPPVVPSNPFTSDADRVTSISPPPHEDFDIRITSSGNIRMPRPCRSNVPVPIPSLTKKSRGRRVPTKTAMTPSFGLGTRARTFTCTVDGCGKRFNRGEHLKRHIRSIHTDEKPHVCPVQKCGKTFSRHDNLCQHMRVHGKFSTPADGGLSDELK